MVLVLTRGTIYQITPPAAASPSVDVQDEGVAIAGNPHSTLNFAGAGVLAVDAGGGVATVTISMET